MLIMAAGMALVPLNDAAAKFLTQDYHVLQITWARYLVQAAILVVLFGPRRTGRMLRAGRLGLQLFRAVLTVISSVAFIGALSFIPLADGIAILFAAPLFLVALSVPVLGETVGAHRWTAVVVGFAAVLVVMRPGLGVMHWAAVLALFAAFSSAGFQLATRILARTDPALVTLVYMAVVGTVMLTGPAMVVWRPPSLAAWGMMAAMGGIATLTHLATIKAIELAPVSVLAPLAYVQIVGASVFGYLVFGELPDAWTWGGVAVIVGAGLYIFHRERRAIARRSAHAAP